MFRQKAKAAPLSMIDDSHRQIADDFCLRYSFDSYRPVDYRIYHKLDEKEMISRLDEHLGKLFAGDVDAGNAEMLDAFLFGIAGEAISDANTQHCRHRDTIRRLIVRRKSDREDLKLLRNARAAELETMRADYEKTCKLLAEKC